VLDLVSYCEHFENVKGRTGLSSYREGHIFQAYGLNEQLVSRFWSRNPYKDRISNFFCW